VFVLFMSQTVGHKSSRSCLQLYLIKYNVIIVMVVVFMLISYWWSYLQ